MPGPLKLPSDFRDAAEPERFHDSEGGEGVVGSVEQLPRREVGRCPVAGGDALRLGETPPEDRTDGGADADLSRVTHFAEDLIEVEDTSERDTESGLDLSTIV